MAQTRRPLPKILIADDEPDLLALMKETLAAFVDAMSETDQAALVTFGSTVNTVQEFTANHSKIKEKLSVLQPTDDETAFYNAIDKGIAVAKSDDAAVPRRRVLITLTDGVNDLSGGVGKADILSHLATDPVPLFLIGFVQGRPTAEEESAIGVMKQFSQASGGRYYDGRNGSAWRGIYFAITRAIRNAFLVEIEVPNFRSDGSVYGLEISLNAPNREWKEKLQLTFPAGGTVTAASGNTTPGPAVATGDGRPGGGAGSAFLYAGCVAVILFVTGGWCWWRRS